MQVGIWIRVSTEEQAQGESPKNHEHRARMYAELKGWQVVELYDLSGVSGKSVVEHPEAKRMLQDVASGKIKALIFSKLARLARNVKELLEISDHFQQYNANLISLEESIDTSTPAGRLLFTVIGALAQWEREEISARVAASVPVRARQGKPTGGKGPFGYMWQDKKLVINPKEAPIVQELFTVFLETKKLQTTAKNMNKRGYRTRNGAKWGKTTVKRILTDPVYKGIKRANYSKSKGNKKSWQLKPQSEWVYFQVEPIISEQLWSEVNLIISQIEQKYPTEPLFLGKYAFSGLVVCGDCNQKMYVMKYKGMKEPRYLCRMCKQKINESVLLERFREGLKCMVVTPEQLQSVYEEDENNIQTKETQLKSLQTELKSVNKKLSSLLDLFSEGHLDKSTLSERMKEIQEQKKQIEAEISRIEGQIAYLKTTEIGKNYLLTQATTLYSLWDNLDYNNRINIARELVNSIIVRKEELVIEIFYLPELMEFCKPDQTNDDLDTFAKQPKYTLILPRPKELPKGYILSPETIGEHIRKRRLDLGLFQREVADFIGVSETTVYNWEKGTEPEIKHIPKIIEFLGYTPFECPDDPIGRLRYFKMVKGLSYERLGELIGKDAEQLADWLSGRIKPSKKNIESVKNYLNHAMLYISHGPDEI